jgi:hypothetical protein
MTKNARRLALALTPGILALALTACNLFSGNKIVDLDCQISKELSEQTQGLQQTSEQIAISIHLDATPSMKGFVNYPAPTRYSQTLDLIDIIATAGWSGGKSSTQYYRFCTKDLPMKRGEYIRAKTPGFYAGGGDFKDSQLKAAISQGGGNGISLIVTDLYQTNLDITSVIEQFKRQYLQKDLAVGILGIRSEFNGQVYDIGINRQKREYITGKDPKKFRPFYIIFLGKHQDIVYFFEKLKQQRSDLISADSFTIFSPKIIEKIALFQNQQFPPQLPKDNTNIREIKTLNNGIAVAKINTPDSIQSFLITRGGNTEIPIPSKVSYHPSPYTLQVDASANEAFGAQVEGFAHRREQDKLSPDEQQALQIKDLQLQKDILNFTTVINPDKLVPAIYNFDMNVMPRKFQEPEWWQKWNFDEGQFANNSSSFDGSTTLNLNLFLQGLKTVTTDLITNNKTVAARLCWAIQRD